MFIRRLAAGVALATVAMTFSIAQASATSLGSTLQCGVNPTGDVHLDADLTCASSFVIGSTAVTTPITIDLRGHTLTVTSPDAPCRFGQPGAMCAILGQGPLHVKDGRIDGSLGLASVRGANNVRDVQIDGDLWMSGVGGHLMSNAIFGGSIHDFSGTSQVADNFVMGGGVIINDHDTQMAVDIDHNLIVGSPGAGIEGVFGQGGEFANDVAGELHGNTVNHPAGPGISLTGALTNLGQFDLIRNRVFNAGGDGILIAGHASPPTPYLGGPVTLTQNLVLGADGYAIDAPWVDNLVGTAIVDGGGNIGHHVTSPTRCVGVVCH